MGVLRTAFLNDFLSSRIVPPRVRVKMLRRLGFNIDATADIRGGATITGKNITIGPGTYLGAEAFLDGDGGLTIGTNCNIAPRVSFYTVTHGIGDTTRRAGKHEFRPITIGDGVWIGGSCVILPGISVGDGCIIGAGAVVTKDCEPHGLYVGFPAKRVRDLDPT